MVTGVDLQNPDQEHHPLSAACRRVPGDAAVKAPGATHEVIILSRYVAQNAIFVGDLQIDQCRVESVPAAFPSDSLVMRVAGEAW